MADSPLISAVAELVRKVARLDADLPIGRESRLIDDLGVDSLDLVGLTLKIQDDYDVEIDEADLPNLTRIGDLADYIAARRPSAAA